MKTYLLPKLFPLSVFAILFILSPFLLSGQQSTKLSADTTAPEIEVIKISEISIKSGEVWTQTNRLYESLILDEDIQKMKIKNDSIIDNLNGLLKSEIKVDLSPKNIRYLNNKKVYWEKVNDKLEKEKTELSANIKTLNDYKHDVQDEILVWENTKTAVKNENTDQTVINRVNELISQLENIINNVQKKNDKLLAMLDKTTSEGIVLIEHIDNIDKELIDKKNEIFKQDQPPFYSLAYLNPDKWKFREPIVFFYNIEVVELLKYINDYTEYFVFEFLLIIILIVVFNYVKR